MYNKSGTSLKLKQKQSYSDHNLPFYHSIKKINKKIKKAYHFIKLWQKSNTSVSNVTYKLIINL